MDLGKIDRLKENHEKELQMCLSKIQQWEKFNADYEALRQRLLTLPDKLSHDITVPFGSNAFTMGKLVHTNEVMVLLGDNWFAEVSSKQAVEIASRRIEQCTKMLDDLRKEEQQFRSWLSYIEEVAVDNENLVEIVETYDPDKENEWREQHAKNVKAHHEKLSEEKKNFSGKSSESNEKDYSELLGKLELSEKLESESQTESEKNNVECSADDMHLSDESNGSKNLQLDLNCCNHGKATSDSEEKTEQGEHNNTNGCNCPNNTKHVRWQDLSKQNIKKITFKHSNPKKKNQQASKNKHEYEEVQPLIQSPSDIYKHFGNLFQTPKSILKIKSPPVESQEPFFPSKEILPNDEHEKHVDKSMEPAFTGTICERTESNDSHQNTSSRPISQFKFSRKNRRK